MDMSSNKYITLFNFLGIPYADDLKVPKGREFQRVLIQDTAIEVFRGKDLDKSPTQTLPLSPKTFDQIFGESAMVIIHDSMFQRESFLVVTDEFFDHGGLESLVKYFQNGGSILIQCVEGIYAIGEMLSKHFGCRWKLHEIESERVVATERGKQVLGNSTIALLPAYCSGKVHFMRCPKGEGLLAKRLYTMEEFEEAWEPDAGEEEEKYRAYRSDQGGQFAVCVYEGFGVEGKIIWNGDRGQNPVLRKPFEGLLAL